MMTKDEAIRAAQEITRRCFSPERTTAENATKLLAEAREVQKQVNENLTGEARNDAHYVLYILGEGLAELGASW